MGIEGMLKLLAFDELQGVYEPFVFGMLKGNGGDKFGAAGDISVSTGIFTVVKGAADCWLTSLFWLSVLTCVCISVILLPLF